MAPDEDVLDAQDSAEKKEEEKQPLKLTVEVEQTNACQRHVAVTISREDVDRYFDEAFAELVPEAEVPGFRPGRAPRKLVEQRFRKQVSEQVKGTLLMDSMTQVTEEQKFAAIGEPDFDFDAIEIPDEGPMTFEFDLEVRPEFDLPQWKGLRLEKSVHKFTSEDVDRRLAELLERYGQVVPHDGPAEPDDFLTVTMSFSHEGEQISRLEEEALRMRPVLSFHDGTMDDFGKVMDGVREGDRRRSKVRLSAGAPNVALRGAELDVDIEVLDVKRVDLPEMDAEFLDDIGGYESEGEVRDAVLNELNRQLQYYQHRRIREQITEQLTKTADWELPEELLNRQSQRELQRAKLELQSAGFSEEDIQAHENALRQNSLAATEMALKEHFILERIAEEQEVQDDPKDYDAEIELIAQQSGDNPRRIRARLEKKGQMDALRNQIVERKVIDLITAEATFDEVDFEPEKRETYAVDFTVSAHDDSDIPEAKHGGEASELPARDDRS